jgi:Alcohol dehydrogenase, class IV
VLSERERDFSWRDGERLIRFGGGALTEAPELLTKHGFAGYVLLCTRRALESADRAGALAEGAAAVLEVPSGGVPDAAASVRGEVGGRPLVALGGGRVLDSAKAIAAVDGLRCAAVPTTLSGAEVTAIHRLPSGAETPRAGLVRPALVIADPELMASAPTPALTATAMNALAHGAEALYAPGANPVGSWRRCAAPSSSPPGSRRPSPTGNPSHSALCCVHGRSTARGSACITRCARRSCVSPELRTPRPTRWSCRQFSAISRRRCHGSSVVSPRR